MKFNQGEIQFLVNKKWQNFIVTYCHKASFICNAV